MHARWLETFIQDLRYGARELRRNPGFASTAIVSLAPLQHESGGRHPGCARGGQEVGALPEPLHEDAAGRAAARIQALSRLRPRARRAATTLRPPLVAMRARKP